MVTSPLHSLTSGSIEETFDEAVATLQSLGLRQSVFEVERLSVPKTKNADKMPGGEVLVLRPSSIQPYYDEMKPGDKVCCTGLRKDAAGAPVLCRIRRMAEGTSRHTITERK